ncbi:Acetylcholine receptor subunit beta-type unc-29 [Aphelenchoides bicaudatus]|nr:Acetylcholine receptor subunit beta-type unc-29 [Aphelenchoides bicaudatus]
MPKQKFRMCSSQRKMYVWPLVTLFLLLCAGTLAQASDDEEKLMIDIFRGYNSLIQPIKHSNDTPIVVKIALQLVLLINVDEKDQCG